MKSVTGGLWVFECPFIDFDSEGFFSCLLVLILAFKSVRQKLRTCFSKITEVVLLSKISIGLNVLKAEVVIACS